MKNTSSNPIAWLPAIISDNMMLQAGVKTCIWGKTGGKGPVTASIAGRSAKGRSDSNGNFKLYIPPLKYGGPYNLRLNDRNIDNVLVGDIWFCSGQSNMELSVTGAKNAEEELLKASNSRIRLFGVPCETSSKPNEDVTARWTECTAETAASFSAAAYFFGKKLHNELKIPVGLINASWGGTKIEPWTRLEALKAFDGFNAMQKLYKDALSVDPLSFHTDPGNAGAKFGYADETCSLKSWKHIKAPGYWKGQGLNIVGAVWVRKTVNLPASWKGRDLYLSLSPIVDADTTYFNGIKIGGMGFDISGAWAVPRKYMIPAALVKPGKNTIAIRIFGRNINGGFTGPEEEMKLYVINREYMSIPLHGNWLYKVELALKPKTGNAVGQAPGSIYNAMVHPFISFPVKGFLWYQAESNVPDYKAYEKLFPIMIADWRKLWGNAKLPFYYVQLPDYPAGNNNEKLPFMREVQLNAQKISNTGMAVTIDGGEKDIHPKNKQMVGDRLARLALAKIYGKKVEYLGPVYRKYAIEGDKIRLYFDKAGLKSSDGRALKGFTIAGSDGVFNPAEAKISGATILVWSRKIKNPASARYAWAAMPDCNLVNKAGLPASPFRTDTL